MMGLMWLGLVDATITRKQAANHIERLGVHSVGFGPTTSQKFHHYPKKTRKTMKGRGVRTSLLRPSPAADSTITRKQAANHIERLGVHSVGFGPPASQKFHHYPKINEENHAPVGEYALRCLALRMQPIPPLPENESRKTSRGRGVHALQFGLPVLGDAIITRSSHTKYRVMMEFMHLD